MITEERTPVTISALLGHPTVLAFFPAAFTSVCTTEICAFRVTWPDLSGVRDVSNRAVFVLDYGLTR